MLYPTTKRIDRTVGLPQFARETAHDRWLRCSTLMWSSWKNMQHVTLACARLAFEDLTVVVQKSAGTLPIRKHKFHPTPLTGGAITKFFDRKQEQVSSGTRIWHTLVSPERLALAQAVLSFLPSVFQTCHLHDAGETPTTGAEKGSSCSISSHSNTGP